MAHKSLSPKTVELLIYIASKLGGKPKYGAIMLNKALYLIDSISYLRSGEAISEFKYIRQDQGPTPSPAQFLSLREYLVTNDEMEKVSVDYFGKVQSKLMAKRQPQIDLFTKSEIFLMDEVLEKIGDMNATELSEYTHQLVAWNIVSDKEELPLNSYLLTKEEPDAKDLQWAHTAIEKHKSTLKE